MSFPAASREPINHNPRRINCHGLCAMTAHLSELLPQTRSPCQVLVVDDDELVREQLRIFLEFAGYTVATAGCAQQALDCIETTHCEVAIVDWEMPDIDGLSLCELIRGSGADIYLLLFTIRGASADVVAGLQAGADDYIVKGASMREVVGRLESGRRIVSKRPQPKRSHGPQPAGASRTGAITSPHPPEPAIALAREYRQCRSRNAPISLLLCAVDNVARLDACFGLEVRSAFLAGIRAEVTKYLLESEWVAPYGGDGFMIVLPDAGAAAAQLIAQKARWALVVAGSSPPLGDNQIAATLSVGLASVETGANLQSLMPVELLRACEQCLTESRREGGNRITARRVGSSS